MQTTTNPQPSDPHKSALQASTERCAGLRAQIERRIRDRHSGREELTPLFEELHEVRAQMGRLDPELARIDEVLERWVGPAGHAWDPKRPIDVELWAAEREADDASVARFAPLHQAAVRGALDAWRHRPRGALALILLLSQYPRHAHRGQRASLAFDGEATALARALRASGGDAELPPPARALVALALTRGEDVEAATEAVETLFSLAQDPIVRGGRRPYARMLVEARKHLRALARFGHDPLLNELLGRESPAEERCYIDQRRGHNRCAPVARSVVRPARVLVLHGMRQSGRWLERRAGKVRKALEGLAELVFVDAPHMYRADDAPLDEQRRCWWHASEGGERYEGWAESLAYLKAIFEEQGPFDGVLGFSQGAAVAGALAAMQPVDAIELRFVICISGFTARSTALSPLMQGARIELPSLHIYGERDVMVPAERSVALQGRFVNGALASHPGGHFAPERWPMDTLSAFVERFVVMGTPESETSPVSPATVQPWLIDEPTLEVLAERVREGLSARTSEDVLEAACGLYQAYDYGPVEHIEDRLPGDGLYRLWMAAHLAIPGGVARHLPLLRDRCGGPALNRLALLACDVADEQPGAVGDALMGLHRAVAEQIAGDLRADMMLVAAGAPPSPCALTAPRVNGATDRRCGLARAVARSFASEPARREAYARYRRAISTISNAIRDAEARTLLPGRKPQRPGVPMWTPEALAAPVSEEVREPLPVPVVPCSLDELTPLLSHLDAHRGQAPAPMSFPRGTLMPDGRLDLCKQVVGPGGIQPLLSSVAGNPQVRRLLLGNNIVGNTGAEAIAEFIRSGASPVRVWYIAGNHIDADGLSPICDALAGQTQVEGLWLKRNPLKAAGAAHIARLLKGPTALQTLDLVNTGLLDEGLAHVVGGLRGNTTLRHLYLGTNGITARGLEPMARYLAEEGRLESLYLSCNRFGDEGAFALAEALKQDAARGSALKRLSLASDRISAEGAVALAEAVAVHPTLEMLSLGWNRATAAVGELGNRIGRQGCEALASLLRQSETLRGLDVSHNDLSQEELDVIADGLSESRSLIALRTAQYGKAIDPERLHAMEAVLERNQAETSLTPEEVWQPRATWEILSVYRTAD